MLADAEALRRNDTQEVSAEDLAPSPQDWPPKQFLPLTWVCTWCSRCKVSGAPSSQYFHLSSTGKLTCNFLLY